VLGTSIQDPGGANLVTQYEYYENSNDAGSYTRRKHVIQPTGSWEKLSYKADGQIEKTYRPWKDAPADPDSVTDTNCQYTLHLYDSAGKLNGTRTFVLGIEVQNTLTVEGSDYEGTDLLTEEQRVYHGSSTTDPLVTETAFLSLSSESGPQKGSTYRATAPDLTATRYVEEKGDFAENTGEFTVNSGGSFTRRITTQGTSSSASGVANKTTRRVDVSDDVGIRRSEDQVFSGSGFEVVGVTNYYYEEDTGRLLITERDGVIVSRTIYHPTVRRESAANGVLVDHWLDAEGRVTQSVKIGVSAGAGYDGQAGIITSYSEDGLTRTSTKSSGGLSLSASSTVDVLGRIVSSTDESGRTTTHSYTDGGRVVTETFPGGVTRATTSYLDGRVKSVAGSGVIQEFHDYTIDGSGNQVHTVYHGTGDSTSARWRRSVTNGQDQLVREEAPGPNGQPIVVEHIYNSKGQRSRTSRTGFADEVYEYDSLGRLSRQGLDVNESGNLEPSSVDPVEESDRYFEKDTNHQWWDVSVNRRYLSNGDDDDAAVTVQKTKLGTAASSETHTLYPDGSSMERILFVDRPKRTETLTITSSLSNLSSVEIRVNGLLVSQSSHTVGVPTRYRYDALGRMTEVVDSRTGLSVETSYGASGMVESRTNEEGDQVFYTYYPSTHANAHQVATMTDGEGGVTRYAYDSLGRLTHKWGSAVYPEAYTYNTFGEMSELRTYRGGSDWNSETLPASFAISPSITTWTYHPGSGLLVEKTDDASETVAYTYHNSGLRASRTWARGVSTAYSYDNAGRLTGVDYSDSTPDVVHTYRRDGQRLSTADAAGARAYSYHLGTGMPAGEVLTGGLLDGLALDWSVDEENRLGGFTAELGSIALASIAYEYNASSQLETVSDGAHSASYAYAADSDLLQSTTFKAGALTKLTGTKVYDNANRLSSVAWVNPSAQTVSSHIYTYDDAGRRTRADMAGGSYWAYSYNAKGEVTSGVKRNATDTFYPGLNFGYSYDEIGNRLTSTVDAAGGGVRTVSYTASALNQYSSISHPPAFDITGSAVESAAVKVNTQIAQRLGPYFRKELMASSQPSWASVAVEVTLPGAGVGGGDIVTARSGHRYIAAATESLAYDEDGNLANDGRWVYSWDGENRLIAMETTTEAVTLGVPRKRLEFAYDASSRRIGKQVFNWDAGAMAWSQEVVRKFVYDGLNMVAELNAFGNLVSRAVWGLDISQTVSEAGGIGGLLWTEIFNPSAAIFFIADDGSGNVVGAVGSSDSGVKGRWDYNAFGEVIEDHSDPLLGVMPFRYSSRYFDVETGLLDYGRRFLNPKMGRWINRDPIFEDGGVNLYGFVMNAPTLYVDVQGLEPKRSPRAKLLPDRSDPKLSDERKKALDALKSMVSNVVPDKFTVAKVDESKALLWASHWLALRAAVDTEGSDYIEWGGNLCSRCCFKGGQEVTEFRFTYFQGGHRLVNPFDPKRACPKGFEAVSGFHGHANGDPPSGHNNLGSHLYNKDWARFGTGPTAISWETRRAATSKIQSVENPNRHLGREDSEFVGRILFGEPVHDMLPVSQPFPPAVKMNQGQMKPNFVPYDCNK
jgi:RHS repeat-associated protein